MKIIKNVPVTGIKKELQREYAFLKKINSDNVIKALEWLDNKDYSGIKMEDIEGQSLNNVLKERNLPVETFAGLAVSIIQGLADIHTQGIIHKDINPANILWNSGRGIVKIQTSCKQ